ncbi:MAG: succinylglutamate desuccinylase/aspartoacylase family protein [Acidisphaera sp.]|nr:succinylglutamate desuccinylase/aspartoacylase family protein [Acidisphaera sp.]
MRGVHLEADVDRRGRSLGWLRAEWSNDRSGYGTVATPVVVIGNGPGPTLLLIAGTHGDEYEGQVALARLARALDPARLRGRVLLLPALNRMAVQAGARLSPVDRGNLNRLFGVGAQTPTGLLATFLERELIPLADAVLDLHSGGRSMRYVPSVFVQDAAEAALWQRTRGIVAAFGAPWCFVKPKDPSETTMLGACGRAGVAYLSTELGGGERLDPVLLALAEAGCMRVAAALGMMQPPEGRGETVRWLSVPGESHYVYAPCGGVFQAEAALGAEVGRGDCVGLVHTPEDPLREPVPVHFRQDGVFVCRRTTARVEPGDCLGHLGVALPDIKGSG